ncbi:CPBP family intramembrane metalloprotease [Corallococcus macrosporus]|uniref:CPBP family intramembrane metalloprotease n=1 Tax=Corallococcus macrosporus TaxID=35 RepID=A0ABS3DKC4_9BACT|nr:MXAN_2755 family glutamic-type intramembrane protease [Corallococcus macrosporus]MBN8231728.1 CPBP family intramembrane metalloprotease [Corallococcus macrosporus]
MSRPSGPPFRLSAVQEAVGLWALGFLGIVVAFLIAGGTSVPKLVATVGFLYLPLIPMRWRDEDYRDYGLSLRAWKEDVRLFLILSAIVGPLFFAGFAGFVQVVPHLPPGLAQHLTPIIGEGHFQPRLPPRFGEWVIDQLFVVALPEEFFYRGYLQARLRDAWPQGRVVLGARLGRAFWVTAVLFALGHLAIFQTWRLAVFFPALLFGWMRERTGTLVGCSLFHAACNLYVRFLEVSFFGGP